MYKRQLYDHLENLLAPMRERYFDLMANPGRIEDVLQAGAAKARKLAVPMMRELREAVGLRNLNAQAPGKDAPAKKEKGKGARFVSFQMCIRDSTWPIWPQCPRPMRRRPKRRPSRCRP